MPSRPLLRDGAPSCTATAWRHRASADGPGQSSRANSGGSIGSSARSSIRSLPANVIGGGLISYVPDFSRGSWSLLKRSA